MVIKASPKRRILSLQSYAMESKIFVICAVLAVFAVDHTLGAPPKDAPTLTENGSYTNKYDNIDVDQVLASKRLVSQYVQCLLDKKPCTPEGQELRSTYFIIKI